MAFYDWDYDDYPEYEYFDEDEEDWLDDYTYYRDEEDAYRTSYYSKVFNNLPDSKFIFDVSLMKNYLKSTVEDVISYEKLYSAVAKIEKLFSLWQKRLGHEWNKGLKNPWLLSNGNDEGCATEGDNPEKAEDKVKEAVNSVQSFCPHFMRAMKVLEECEIMHQIFGPGLSDDEDIYDMIGNYESDEWDSSLDDILQLPVGKASKPSKDSADGKLRYQKSAEKFFAAFPRKENAEDFLNDLLTMKNWIRNIFVSNLTRNIGRQLPQLVMENLFEMLLNRFDEPQLKISSIAMTERFIDVETVRKRELYLVLLEMHAVLFEILYQNPNASDTAHVRELITKLSQTVLHRFTMLEELVSWLQGDCLTSNENHKGFMSGLYHCKVLKSVGKNFDCRFIFNNGSLSSNGRHLAVHTQVLPRDGLPKAYDVSMLKVYDVSTYECVRTQKIDRNDVILSVAMLDDHFALLLKKSACCCIELYELYNAIESSPVLLELGASCKEGTKKLLYTKFGTEKRLIVQKEDEIIVVDVNNEQGNANMAIQKTFYSLELLGVKEHFMLARRSVKIGYFNIASTVETDSDIKIYDLRSTEILATISQPKREGIYPKNWMVALNTAPGSLQFVIWIDERVQLWDLGGGIEKKRELNLGKRLSNGTNCVFNGDILAVESVQNSCDESYEYIHLNEILFYDTTTGDICYHETYCSAFDRPQSLSSICSGHVYGMLMGENVLITQLSSDKIRICKFGLSHEKMISLQVVELMEKRKEEEMKRKLKEAEKKRQNEERMRRKEEQTLKRLEKKRQQRETQKKKKQQVDTLRNVVRTGAFVIGVVTEWRVTYGFLRVQGIGDAFIHISDVIGRPHITLGLHIRCQLQDQIGHSRPKAIQATVC